MRISDWSSDVCSSDLFGRQHVERKFAAVVVGGEGAAVDGDRVELRTETANRHEASFATIALDRHTGDALKRFGDILVGQLAHVLGDDRIDDRDILALQVDRGALADRKSTRLNSSH